MEDKISCSDSGRPGLRLGVIVVLVVAVVVVEEGVVVVAFVVVVVVGSEWWGVLAPIALHPPPFML